MTISNVKELIGARIEDISRMISSSTSYRVVPVDSKSTFANNRIIVFTEDGVVIEAMKGQLAPNS